MATYDDILTPGAADDAAFMGVAGAGAGRGNVNTTTAAAVAGGVAGAVGAGAPALGGAVSGAAGGAGAAPNLAPAEKKPMSYVEMMQQLNPYKAPTPEEVEKARKKEKRDRTFAALGDGIAALANLYFAGKGAANSFNPQQGMYAATSARWDKYNKEMKEQLALARQFNRDARQDFIADRNYNFQVSQADRQQKNADRSYELQKSQADLAQQNADWQHDFQKSQADWQHEFQTGQAERQQKNADRNYNLQAQAQKQAQERWQKEFEAGAHHGTGGNSLGKGGVVLSMGNGKNKQISLADLSSIFFKLPEEVQAQVTREQMLDNRKKPIKDRTTGEIITKDRIPTAEEMLTLIGKHLYSDENVRKAWMNVVGAMPMPSADATMTGGTDWSQYQQGVQQATDWSQFEVK